MQCSGSRHAFFVLCKNTGCVVLAYNTVLIKQALIMTCVLLPARQMFPLHISQDGNQSGIAELARSYAPAIFHMQHVEPDNFPTKKQNEPVAYYRIASHYRFIMQQIFDCWQYPKLIFLEV